jgi:hypothetical protein
MGIIHAEPAALPDYREKKGRKNRKQDKKRKRKNNEKDQKEMSPSVSLEQTLPL